MGTRRDEPAPVEHIDERIRARLVEAFNSGAWKVLGAPRSTAAKVQSDLVVRSGRRKYAVALKTAREARRSDLEGQLAVAILQSRKRAHELGAMPLALVGGPSLSEKLLATLREFAERYGDGIAWGAVDASGIVEMHGPGLERVRGIASGATRPTALKGSKRFDPFSDRCQWLLKILLSPRLPERLRLRGADGATVDTSTRNALALSRLGGVSLAVTSRLVNHLRSSGHLAEGTPLRLLRVEKLLDDWQAASRKRPLEVPARWLFPVRDSGAKLRKTLRRHVQQRGRRASLGLFAACDSLGFPLVTGVVPHAYIEKITASELDALGLAPCRPGEAPDVFVRQPRFPESVFRGVQLRDEVPVSDVIQCWLDVSDHPARGPEMAAHLWKSVLTPALRSGK